MFVKSIIMENLDCKTYRLAFGNALYFRRTCLGLSVEDVAKFLDIKPTNYRRIESGKFSPGLDVLNRLAHVLGCVLTIVPAGCVEVSPVLQIENYDVIPGDKISIQIDSDSFYKVTVIKEKINFELT